MIDGEVHTIWRVKTRRSVPPLRRQEHDPPRRDVRALLSAGRQGGRHRPPRRAARGARRGGPWPALAHRERRHRGQEGNWDCVLVSEHDDREALAVYADHPAHIEAATIVRSLMTESATVDYEFADSEQAVRAVRHVRPIREHQERRGTRPLLRGRRGRRVALPASWNIAPTQQVPWSSTRPLEDRPRRGAAESGPVRQRAGRSCRGGRRS